MRLTSVAIKNFRSFNDNFTAEFNSNYVTFSGENNCGKSNVLRALDLFFNDKVDNRKYNSEYDMNMHLLKESPKKRTDITCSFELDLKKDRYIIKRLNKLKSDGNIKNVNQKELKMSYYFTKNNTSQIQYVDPITNLRTQNKQIDDFFQTGLRRSVDFIYIPAIKDFKSFLDKDLSHELLKRIFNTWGGAKWSGAQALKSEFSKVKTSIETIISESNKNVTEILKEQNEDIKQFIFNLPFKDIIDFLSYLPISIDDGTVTDILQKGSGLQSITLYALLRYLVRYAPSNKFASAQYIWAIEEPETFLHPKAQKILYNVLLKYSTTTQIICTTHSFYFLNTNQLKSNYLLKKESKTKDAIRYQETIAVNIKDNEWEPFLIILGDFKPNFVPENNENKKYFFVEGDIDIDYIKATLELFPTLKYKFNSFNLCNGSGTEIVNKAIQSKKLFNFNTIVLVDGDAKGRGYFDKLIGNGFQKDIDLFIISKAGMQNPTMEGIVCNRVRQEEFKKTMPKEVTELYFNPQTSIFDKIFDNTVHKTYPEGWNESGIKRKLCDYMIKNGTKDDYGELKNLLVIIYNAFNSSQKKI
jgi:putative ATP-dependent endonuclease of the OLD family